MNQTEKGCQISEYWSSDMPDDYTVIDTETTGLGNTDRIIEIAAVKVQKGVVVSSFEKLVNPGIHISSGASKVKGITDSMVKHCPSFSEIREAFVSFIGNDILVGHNIPFDLRFINRELSNPLKNKYIDTLKLSRNYIDDIDDFKLATLVNYFGLDKKQEHRALGDVELTYLVFEKIKDLIIESEFEDISSVDNPLSLKELAALLLGFDSILEEYDKKIVEYLSWNIKFKKNLIEEVPKIPQNIENSIFINYRKAHLIDEAQFKRLLSIAKKKLNQYRLRDTIVMRIDAKTRTFKEPFDAWQDDHRDLEFEDTLKRRASENQRILAGQS